MFICDFHCVAKDIEGWLKICSLILIYSQIWLNPPRDNRHFFYFFQISGFFFSFFFFWWWRSLLFHFSYLFVHFCVFWARGRRRSRTLPSVHSPGWRRMSALQFCRQRSALFFLQHRSGGSSSQAFSSVHPSLILSTAVTAAILCACICFGSVCWNEVSKSVVVVDVVIIILIISREPVLTIRLVSFSDVGILRNLMPYFLSESNQTYESISVISCAIQSSYPCDVVTGTCV